MAEIPSYLNDGLARSRAHPDTFEVPSPVEVAGLKIGDYVKIGLEKPDGAGERFWGRLTVIDTSEAETRCTGIVSNDLQRFPEYPDGAPIAFLSRHILGTLN